MQVDGYGGRAGNSFNEPLTIDGHPAVLTGLITTDWPELLPPRDCANSKCGYWFLPYSDGELYCSEACDLDANPHYKGKSLQVIDHTQRYTNTVRGELASVCQANGIDKSEAGYAVSGFGTLEVVINEQDGTAAPMPVWAVTVSLRSLLLGKEPVGARLQVPGVLPPDSEFRIAVKRLVPAVDQARKAEFNDHGNSINPFEVKRA